MKRALLIGIDHYDRFSGLNGCVNDVNALETLLRRNDDNSPNFDCQKRTSATGGVTRDAAARRPRSAARRCGRRRAALLRRPRCRLRNRRGACDPGRHPGNSGNRILGDPRQGRRVQRPGGDLDPRLLLLGRGGRNPPAGEFRHGPQRRRVDTRRQPQRPGGGGDEPRAVLDLPRRSARRRRGRRPRKGDHRGALLLSR